MSVLEAALPDPGTVTRLLHDWAAGDRNAFDQLLPLVHAELRQLAAAYVAGEGRPNPTLQPTALVNEAYLRLVEVDRHPLDRRHFYALAARIMRNVLTDYARRRNRDKRGGGVRPLSLDEVLDLPDSTSSPESALFLAEALDRLEQLDARQCRILELSFFGGLTLEEIASELDVSTATVFRDLRDAKAWLRLEIMGPTRHDA